MEQQQLKKRRAARAEVIERQSGLQLTNQLAGDLSRWHERLAFLAGKETFSSHAPTDHSRWAEERADILSAAIKAQKELESATRGQPMSAPVADVDASLREIIWRLSENKPA